MLQIGVLGPLQEEADGALADLGAASAPCCWHQFLACQAAAWQFGFPPQGKNEH